MGRSLLWDIGGTSRGLRWAFSDGEERLCRPSWEFVGLGGGDLLRKVPLGRVLSAKKSGRVALLGETGGLVVLTYRLRGRMSGAERPRTCFETGLGRDSPHFFGEKVRDRLTPGWGPPIISLAPQRGASNLKAR